MVLDQTGSLAGMRRHDYLPFGEELTAGVGGRTTGQGYSRPDGLRQKFTSKERDDETGLDYFIARYYSPTQGRFTSPDEFTGGPDELFDFVDDAADNPTFYAEIEDPRSLNKYQYAYNNPLFYVDPDGHQATEALRRAGEELQRSRVPALERAGVVLIVVGAVASKVDLKKAADGFAEAFKGSQPGCLAGIDCSGAVYKGISNLIYSKDKSSTTEVEIDGNQHPEAAQHAHDAQKAGKPDVIEVGDRAGTKGRRKEAMKGHPRVKGKDRDEYPPAWSKQGGRGASVRPISPRDNRGSGAAMGHRIRGLKPGARVRIKPVNVPNKKGRRPNE